MARPERLELPTLWFEARCSIQLSYGRAEKLNDIAFDRCGQVKNARCPRVRDAAACKRWLSSPCLNGR